MRRLLPTALPVPLQDAYPEVPDVPGRWVALGMASAVDGATAVDGRSGALGGAGDRAAFRAVRGLADVVVVGRRTAEVERYGRVRPLAGHAGRRARGQAPHPVIAVVTASGRIDPAVPLLHEDGPTPLVLTTASGADVARSLVDGRAEVVTIGVEDADVVPPLALVETLERRGLRRIVVEGGPTLNHALLAAGVVDELFVTLAPSLVGGGPGLAGDALGAEPVRLVLHELRVHDSELLCRYRLLPTDDR